MKLEKNWQWPARICPWCGKEFIPSRKNQIYCCRGCQIMAANDRRDRFNAFPKELEKKRIHNLNVLKKISTKVKEGDNFHLSLLKYEDFHFGLEMLKTLNVRTGNYILWTYQYGLEMVDPEKELFAIHR